MNPDAVTSPGRGGRALLRLGFRTARRNPWRSLFVIALLAFPIAAATTVAAAQRTLSPDLETQQTWQLGQAQWTLQFPTAVFDRPDVAEATSVIDSAVERSESARVQRFLDWAAATSVDDMAAIVADAFGTDVQPGWSSGLVSGDRWVQYRSLDATAPVFDGIYQLIDGRYAAGADEITLSTSLADRLDVGIGDALTLPDTGDLTVVGLHAASAEVDALSILTRRDTTPRDALVEFFIGDVGVPDPAAALEAAVDAATAPGTYSAAEQNGVFWSAPRATQFGDSSNAPLRLDRPPVLSGVVAAMLLVEVALIAAAAFTTGARRRMREFGLLATVGADRSHVRRLVLAEAMVLGVAGAALGALGGLVATDLLSSTIASLADHTVVDVSARPGDLLAPALLAVVAAVAAAWFPARTAARVSAITALAGRTPTRPLRARVVPAGLVLVGLGLVITALQSARSRTMGTIESSTLVFIVFGCLLCLAGSALLATWVVGAVGRRSDRLPLTVRLVARDAARQQFRSAVAIAGLVVITAVPVIVGAVAVTDLDSRDDYSTYGEPLDDEIVLTSYEYGADDSGDARREEALAAAIERARAVAPIVQAGTLQVLGTDLGEFAQESYAYDDSTGASTTMALGTDDAVRALRLPPEATDALAAGQAVGIGTSGSTVQFDSVPTLAGYEAGVWETVLLDVTNISDRPFNWTTPSVLLPPEMADSFGLVPVREMTLLVTAEPLTTQQIDALNDNATWPGALDLRVPTDVSIQTMQLSVAASNRAEARLAQAIALGASTVIVLVIGGCLVAIAATESDRDIATMIRVGAAPSLRRRILATQAWYHAVVGAVLAVPVGLLLLVALRQALTDPAPLRLPWVSIGAVVLVVPVVLGLVVGLTVRSRPPTQPGIAG